jgi:hypothetical protein
MHLALSRLRRPAFQQLYRGLLKTLLALPEPWLREVLVQAVRSHAREVGVHCGLAQARGLFRAGQLLTELTERANGGRRKDRIRLIILADMVLYQQVNFRESRLKETLEREEMPGWLRAVMATATKTGHTRYQSWEHLLGGEVRPLEHLEVMGPLPRSLVERVESSPFKGEFLQVYGPVMRVEAYNCLLEELLEEGVYFH